MHPRGPRQQLGRVRHVRQLQVGLLRRVASAFPSYWLGGVLPAVSAAAVRDAAAAVLDAAKHVLRFADSPPERQGRSAVRARPNFLRANVRGLFQLGSGRPAPRGCALPMASSVRVWPGFATKKKDNFLPGFGPITHTAGGKSDGYLDFTATKEKIEADAKLTADMWIRAPPNKMTLASVQTGVDANNDGLIDTDEFKQLLQASGYKGGNADAIFAQIDADGDGTLTEAEIKLLSQGSSTLKSGKM